MAREWYFQDAGQVLGPLMPADLRRLAHQGRINADTLIRKGADGKWVRAAKVPGLLDTVTAPAAPVGRPAAIPPAPAPQPELGFFAYWNAYWKAARGPVWLPLLLVVPLVPVLSLLKPLLGWQGLLAVPAALLLLSVTARAAYLFRRLGSYYSVRERTVPARPSRLAARVGFGSAVMLLPLIVLGAIEYFTPPHGLLAQVLPKAHDVQQQGLAVAGLQPKGLDTRPDRGDKTVADTGKRGTETGTAGEQRGLTVTPSGGKTWALVIGVKEYQSVPKLDCTAADADALADTLVKVGGVPEEQILRITDDRPLKPDHATLAKKVPEWLASTEIQPEDTVLLFFSGHGLLGPEETMYLAPRDIKLNAVKDTALPAAELREQLRTCRAGTKLLLLDACHSGASKSTLLDGSKLAGAFKYAPGVVTISACKGDQFSWESKDLGHGLFSHFLLKGLNGAADRDGNGLIDTDEIYRHVSDNVPLVAQKEFKTSQDPVRWIGPDVTGIPVILKLPREAVRPPAPAVAGPPPPRPAEDGKVDDILKETFQETKTGNLPAGWVGDASLGVAHEGNKAWLQTHTAGFHEVRTPPLAIIGDFQVELEMLLPQSDATLRITLESETTHDLKLVLVRGSNNVQLVHLANAEMKYFSGLGETMSRLVLQREGDVYTVMLDGKEIAAHRLPEAGNYQRLGIALDQTITRIGSVTVRQARAAGSGPLPKPPALTDGLLFVDFGKVERGLLAKDWTGDSALGALRDGSVGWLRSSKEGKFTTKSPPLQIQGNFLLWCRFHLPQSDSTLTLKLAGDGGKDLLVNLVRGSNNVQIATLGDAAPTNFSSLGEYPSRLVLRRKGDVFTLAIDGNEVVVHRIDQSGGYRSVEMGVDQSGTTIHEIGVKLLGAGE
jgi:hypothetical protein